MKCPIDQTEMEKGLIDPEANAWISQTNFTGKMLSFGKGLNAKLSQGKPLWAYRCPKCEKIELTTEVK